MISSLSINFYLNELKPKGKSFPIYLRITVKRKKSEIATKHFVLSKDWDSGNQQTKKNSGINEELTSIKNQIYDIVKRLEKDNKIITSQIIKSYLKKEDKLDANLIEFYESFISRHEKGGEVEKVTVNTYGYTKKYLQEFLFQEKKVNDMLIEQVDYKFLSDFDLFLLNQKINKTEKTLERNTVNKHHSRFRTILIRATKEGHIFKNPYSDFKLKSTPSKRTFLTNDELQKIIEHPLGNNESLIKVRDIFIFSVYTGLRFKDAQMLNINQVLIDKGKNPSINIIQEKTQEVATIPLLKPALAIVNKYDNAEREITGKVLPKISNQKLNTYLKVIADMAGIEKHFSHHIARHTCATTILLSNEVPIEAVSKWLGHTNIKTTQIYAKISNQYLQQIANKIESKI